jgi:lipopolysaccharide biosynthesis glycosyltransferase
MDGPIYTKSNKEKLDKPMVNAYVTLFMGAPHYIYGIIAMAHSLRKTETKHKIVCMLTPDLLKYKDILYTVFDNVNVVPYLKYQTELLATKKQNNIYKNWKDVSYTKWQCLSLIAYDKICFLDADLIIQKNIDHLFDMNAPAGRFGNSWDSLVAHYDTFQHGDFINRNAIENGLKKGYVVNGHCVILEPSIYMYNEFRKFMNCCKYQRPAGCLSMADECALVMFFQSEGKHWTQINNTYNIVPWKNNYKDAFIIHFFNKEKPWSMNRGKWADLKLWYTVWDEIVVTFPNTVEKLNKI